MFTPTVPNVIVIANGFQPHSECRKRGCVVRALVHAVWIGVEAPRSLKTTEKRDKVRLVVACFSATVSTAHAFWVKQQLHTRSL